MVVNLGVVTEWADDPLRFIGTLWPDDVVYDKQAEILLSVRDNPETFVHAANETGKTRVAAWAALWFFRSRESKVLAMSSTQDQLMQALWPEIDRLVRSAAFPLGVIRKHRELRILEPDGRKEYPEFFLRGRVANDPEAFQGAHLATDGIPRVFVIMDEASAIDDEFYDAATSQAHRLLVIGNPLRTGKFFHRLCSKKDAVDPDTGKLFRKVIHIGGADSPNVIAGKIHAKLGLPGQPPPIVPGILSYNDYRVRLREWEPGKRRMRLDGHFDTGEQRSMFPVDWLDTAEQAWSEFADVVRDGSSRKPVGPCWMGIDVAEGGRDLTVWVIIDCLGIVAVIAKRTPDTSIIVPETHALMHRFEVSDRHVAFDRGAGGKQYVDLMRARGQKVRAITFGERPRDKVAYRNRRAEMYGRLRESIDPRHWTRESENSPWTRCFMIPPHEHELREELVTLPLLYDEGKLYLPPKAPRPGKAKGETIEGIIGRSPDRADGLVLANWARVAPVKGAPPRVSGPMGAIEGQKARETTGGPSRLAQRIFGPGG